PSGSTTSNVTCFTKLFQYWFFIFSLLYIYKPHCWISLYCKRSGKRSILLLQLGRLSCSFRKIKLYKNNIIFIQFSKFFCFKHLHLQTHTPPSPITSCKEQKQRFF